MSQKYSAFTQTFRLANTFIFHWCIQNSFAQTGRILTSDFFSKKDLRVIIGAHLLHGEQLIQLVLEHFQTSGENFDRTLQPKAFKFHEDYPRIF